MAWGRARWQPLANLSSLRHSRDWGKRSSRDRPMFSLASCREWTPPTEESNDMAWHFENIAKITIRVWLEVPRIFEYCRSMLKTPLQAHPVSRSTRKGSSCARRGRDMVKTWSRHGFTLGASTMQTRCPQSLLGLSVTRY
jgi:hypothetical protein